MKKITRAFLFTFILASMLVVTGCGLFDRAREAVEETYDTWYLYTGEQTLSIPLGSDADDESDTVTKSLDNVEFYVYFDADDGLKVAVQAETEQNVELLGGLATKKITTYTGGTKQYTKKQFGAVKWAAMMSTVPFEEADEPEVSANPDRCIILVGDEAGDLKIQWKKVLKRCLINALLGDD